MLLELSNILNNSYEFAVRLCSYLNRDEICNLIRAMLIPAPSGYCLLTQYGAFWQIAREYIDTKKSTKNVYFRPKSFEYCETTRTFSVSVEEVYSPKDFEIWFSTYKPNLTLSHEQAEKLARGALETNFKYGFTKSGPIYDPVTRCQPSDLCLHLNNIYITNFEYEKRLFIVLIVVRFLIL